VRTITEVIEAYGGIPVLVCCVKKKYIYKTPPRPPVKVDVSQPKIKLGSSA